MFPNSPTLLALPFISLIAAAWLSQREISLAAAPAPPAPVFESEEGKRAFEDLGKYYADNNAWPEIEPSLNMLALKNSRGYADETVDPAERASAGRYMLALLAQSRADETNGRSPKKFRARNLPKFPSKARDFRRSLNMQIARVAKADESLDALEWILSNEDIEYATGRAMKALQGIESPAANKLLSKLLQQPHPDTKVMTALISETVRRKLIELKPELLKLQHHHRRVVREAVREAAEKLAFADGLEEQKSVLSEGLEKRLKELSALMNLPVPKDAKWVKATYQHPPADDPSDYVQPFTTLNITTPVYGRVDLHRGWLLKQDTKFYHILNTLGQEVRLHKQRAQVVDSTLKEEVERIVAERKKRDEQAKQRRSNWMWPGTRIDHSLGPFPELLLTLWSYQLGDKDITAKLLFPRLEKVENDRKSFQRARDWIAEFHYRKMMALFSGTPAYESIIPIGRHLSRKGFQGYPHQAKAIELTEQLADRIDEDFKTLTVPSFEQWAKMKEELSREEQIIYLVKRLRLTSAESTWHQNRLVINPYATLRSMKLTVVDLPALIPAVADNSFIPLSLGSPVTFIPPESKAYPGRVNTIAAHLFNEVAKQKRVDLIEFENLDEPGRELYLQQLRNWCGAHAGKSEEGLILLTLRTTENQAEFTQAVQVAIARKYHSALAVLVDRYNDNVNWRWQIPLWCLQLNTQEAVKPARAWLLGENDGWSQYYSALILLRHGDKEHLEGLQELDRLVMSTKLRLDDVAIDVLIETGKEKALKLACRALKAEDFKLNHLGEKIVHKLFAAGRVEALDLLRDGLDDATPSTRWQKYERRDEFGQMVYGWRLDRFVYNRTACAEVRTQQCALLKAWLEEQHALIREGKTPKMRLPHPHGRPASQVPTPTPGV